MQKTIRLYEEPERVYFDHFHRRLWKIMLRDLSEKQIFMRQGLHGIHTGRDIRKVNCVTSRNMIVNVVTLVILVRKHVQILTE